MTMLSVLPVCLLAMVAAWFIWPVLADPIARRLAARRKASGEAVGDEFFRTLVQQSGPEVELLHVERN